MLRCLNQRQCFDNLVVEFGRGEILVDVGTIGGTPAVFLWLAKEPRSDLLGGRADGGDSDEVVDRTILRPGEIVLTFPTMEQATTVRDAILGLYRAKKSPEEL